MRGFVFFSKGRTFSKFWTYAQLARQVRDRMRKIDRIVDENSHIQPLLRAHRKEEELITSSCRKSDLAVKVVNCWNKLPSKVVLNHYHNCFMLQLDKAGNSLYPGILCDHFISLSYPLFSPSNSRLLSSVLFCK